MCFTNFRYYWYLNASEFIYNRPHANKNCCWRIWLTLRNDLVSHPVRFDAIRWNCNAFDCILWNNEQAMQCASKFAFGNGSIRNGLFCFYVSEWMVLCVCDQELLRISMPPLLLIYFNSLGITPTQRICTNCCQFRWPPLEPNLSISTMIYNPNKYLILMTTPRLAWHTVEHFCATKFNLILTTWFNGKHMPERLPNSINRNPLNDLPVGDDANRSKLITFYVQFLLSSQVFAVSLILILI